MMAWVVLTIMVSLSPVILLLVLVLFLFIIVVMLAFILDSYLFSYLVFLLFMSGLIMLLMYFCSVILNEKYFFGVDLVVLSVVCLVLAGVRAGDFSSIQSEQVWPAQDYPEFYGLLKYLAYSYSLYSLFFIIYLLLCLLVVYEVVKRSSGPLRMKI